MNMLLFEKSELDSAGLFRVTGDRAQHIAAILKLKPGDSIRVGLRDFGMGEGRIESCCAGEFFVKPGELLEEAPLPPRDLLVVLPRPQSLKKVLQTAATFGVRRVFFIASERGEKSYFSSAVLRPETLWEHLRLGLEQGVSTRAPEILVLSERKPRKSPGFTGWINEEFPEASYVRLFAHPEAVHGGNSLPMSEVLDASRGTVVAVGPEGGWTPAEEGAFFAAGFRPFRLGRRILRVETAVAAALAQHDLISLMAGTEDDRTKELRDGF